jgi:TPR repeat protein
MKIIAAVLFLLTTTTQTFAQSASFLPLLEKAKSGDVAAQNEVGIAYSEGHDVKPNQKLAVYWFRKSAEQGYAIGTCNLALHYAMGWGVKGNITLMWKYVFAAHALDGLKCNPADVYYKFRKRHCSMQKGWQLAVAWLRVHPNFKNDFGEKPWNESQQAYPITVRENRPSIQLPIKNSEKCGRRRAGK